MMVMIVCHNTVTSHFCTHKGLAKWGHSGKDYKSGLWRTAFFYLLLLIFACMCVFILLGRLCWNLLPGDSELLRGTQIWRTLLLGNGAWWHDCTPNTHAALLWHPGNVLRFHLDDFSLRSRTADAGGWGRWNLYFKKLCQNSLQPLFLHQALCCRVVACLDCPFHLWNGQNVSGGHKMKKERVNLFIVLPLLFYITIMVFLVLWCFSTSFKPYL